MRPRAWVLIVLLLMPTPLWAQALLQFDPFSRPTPAPEPVARPSDNEQNQDLRWSPELIATVVAGPRSMANISGRLIRLGQKLQGSNSAASTEETD